MAPPFHICIPSYGPGVGSAVFLQFPPLQLLYLLQNEINCFFFPFSDRMPSFKYNQEPSRFRNSESGTTEPNGFHGRAGSSKLEPPKSNQNHHNTVVASVKNEASRRGLNHEQELDILLNKEPDEICLAEFSEGNGVVVQKNKKNGKQSKQFILVPHII